MTRIIADEALLTKLHHLTGEVEICDAQGKVLGVVLPVEDSRQLYHDMRWPADLTPEEVQRRFREGGGKPLAQIWKELGRP